MELLSVTDLNEYLQRFFDGNAFLSDILVCGEISNFKHHSSGHCYFSLKDEASTVRVVLFRTYATRLRFTPENGMKVIVHGRVSVFPRNGEYQIYADEIQPDGVGVLAVAFEQLRRKLEAEGLFDAALKRPLPPYPSCIGVITSPTGAAVRDILQILGRRYPLARVVLYPALVQGPGAPESLCEGLRIFSGEIPVDVIIIGRGGGSMEDLWCFNHETVVRAVAASPVPVISAVGHETDFTLCDFVADLRAPTPSAAAELATPDLQELLCRIDDKKRRMEARVTALLSSCRQRLDRLSGSAGLRSAKYVLDEKRMLLDQWVQRLDAAGENLTAPRRAAFGALCAKLGALNPAGVLERGYGIVFRENERTVTSVNELVAGDPIRIRLKDGDVYAVTQYGKEGKHGREKTEV